MKVLIVTQSRDVGIAATVAALEARGADVVRFDSDRFPTDLQLSVWQSADESRTFLSTPRGRLDLAELHAIWFRWLDPGDQLPAMPADVRAAAVRESTSLVEALAAELDVFVLDPIARAHASRNKLHQHRLAREAGLSIPRSLTTNDPAEVRAFAGTCPGGLIAKMHDRFTRMLEGTETETRFEMVATAPLDCDDPGALDGLDLCPMIFQEDVPKKVELRVTVVGHQVFAAEVDSQSTPANRSDWRVDQDANVWRPSELPPEIRDKLLRVLTRLGLNYGACDLILTPDGQYVFLEVNCLAGMFTWIEDQTGLPISAAIADLLVGRLPRRV
jgi:glutathione synthase/RimK-type ligase-like ATP-grasp enzyme